MGYWNKISGKHCLGMLTWNILLPYCLWQIWTTKNNNTFEHKSNSVSLANTLGLVTEFVALKPHCGQSHQGSNNIQVKWTTPRKGMTKLNTDGAVPHAPVPGGYEGVLRNHQGRWVMSYHNAMAHTSPAKAELKAIKSGLELAIQH